MKCLLLADDRLDLLATLEPVLKHWGYRVLTATNIPQANAFLVESAPALLVIGSHLLARHGPDLAHYTGGVSDNFVVHLHRFQHCQGLAHRDRSASGHT